MKVGPGLCVVMSLTSCWPFSLTLFISIPYTMLWRASPCVFWYGFCPPGGVGTASEPILNQPGSSLSRLMSCHTNVNTVTRSLRL